MNPLELLIAQLMQQAGPRGATFAGRVIPQGQTPSLQSVMTRLPTESPDAEGMGGAAATAFAAKGSKGVLKPGWSDGLKNNVDDIAYTEEQIARQIKAKKAAEAYDRRLSKQREWYEK